MKGKIIKLNDFKFTFGQSTTCFNDFSAFRRRKNCNKYILHAMGGTTKEETVFTRYEFEKQLNCLKDFLKVEE